MILATRKKSRLYVHYDLVAPIVFEKTRTDNKA